MKTEYNDIPIDKLIATMEDLISKGWTCYVKWLCEGCQERVTSDEPNTFFTKGFTHTIKEDGSTCGFKSFPNEFGLLIIKGVVVEK